MRQYRENVLVQVKCNKCGKSLRVKQGILLEECFYGEHLSGYFSKMDGCRQKFDLCETCYNDMIEKFEIPVDMSEETELL